MGDSSLRVLFLKTRKGFEATRGLPPPPRNNADGRCACTYDVIIARLRRVKSTAAAASTVAVSTKYDLGRPRAAVAAVVSRNRRGGQRCPTSRGGTRVTLPPAARSLDRWGAPRLSGGCDGVKTTRGKTDGCGGGVKRPVNGGGRDDGRLTVTRREQRRSEHGTSSEPRKSVDRSLHRHRCPQDGRSTEVDSDFLALLRHLARRHD